MTSKNIQTGETEMELTPNDLRNYEFSTQMRGYDRGEVAELLNVVSSGLERLKQDNLKLSMELDSVKTQLASIKEHEDTIKGAAIDARRAADRVKAEAKAEVEQMIAQAKEKASELVASKEAAVKGLKEQITQLKQAKRQYVENLRRLLRSHLEVVEQIAAAADDEQLNLDDVPDQTDSGLEIEDSTDVTVGKREGLASRPSRHETIRTEEANQADRIIEVPDQQQQTPTPEPAPSEPANEPPQAQQPQDQAQPSESTATAATPEVPGSQTPEEAEALDPELAEALRNYRAVEDKEPADKPAPQPQAPATSSAPAPTEAESAAAVPPGFVAREEHVTVGNDTDQIPTDQQPSMEPNPIPAEQPQPAAQPQPQPPQTPPNGGGDDLADALDQVAAKFEEEMDKAAKS
jgi:DivIVA domain-containing protein